MVYDKCFYIRIGFPIIVNSHYARFEFRKHYSSVLFRIYCDGIGFYRNSKDFFLIKSNEALAEIIDYLQY